MRCLFGFICVLALGVIGCSETAGTGGSSGVGGDGGSAGMGGGGAGGFGGAGETATLQVLPMELDEDGEQVRLAGVRICEVDTNNCGVSDGLVPVELLVPANREISFTQESEGYDPLIRSDVMPPGLTIVVPVMTPAAPVAEQFEGLMSPYPMEGTGAVFLIVWGGAAGDPIRGATVELVDGTGKRFYIDGEGTWSADLTATTVEEWAVSWKSPPVKHKSELGVPPRTARCSGAGRVTRRIQFGWRSRRVSRPRLASFAPTPTSGSSRDSTPGTGGRMLALDVDFGLGFIEARHGTLELGGQYFDFGFGSRPAPA